MLAPGDIEVLDAVYSTVAPDGAPVDGAAQMAAALERLPEGRRNAIAGLLRSMRTPVLGALSLGRPARFSALDAEMRARYLRAMAASPIPALRTAYAAVVRLALFIAYAGDDAGARNRLWDRVGYPGPRADVPLSIGRTSSADVPDRVDAIVVGSGAGGGVAAGVLAAAGLRVLVLEAGPWPDDVAREQRERDGFAELYLESALCASSDLGVSILAGACVGGGTAVNWTTALRLHRDVGAQWGRASNGVDFGATLARHYDDVERRLRIAPAVEHNANNAAIVRGSTALGWSWEAQPRNAGPCGEGCGYCCFGCAYGEKRSTDRTYLDDVLANGGWIVANAPVRAATIEGERATGVVVAMNGVERQIRANLVVAAAGALRTPQLLANSGVNSAHLGRHLRLHPTTAVIGRFAEPVETWHGSLQSALCDEFARIDDLYGVTFEVAPAHPGLSALSVPWLGRDAHAEEMSRMRYAAALIVLTRDRGEGRVTTGAEPAVHYSLSPMDARNMRIGIARLSELATAAGAVELTTLHDAPLRLDLPATPAATAAFSDRVKRAKMESNRIGVFSAHQMGTARMNTSPVDGVVDEDARVHGIGNLLVADSSVFPLASGVNPMLTIMALAHRTATRALERN